MGERGACGYGVWGDFRQRRPMNSVFGLQIKSSDLSQRNDVVIGSWLRGAETHGSLVRPSFPVIGRLERPSSSSLAGAGASSWTGSAAGGEAARGRDLASGGVAALCPAARRWAWPGARGHAGAGPGRGPRRRKWRAGRSRSRRRGAEAASGRAERPGRRGAGQADGPGGGRKRLRARVPRSVVGAGSSARPPGWGGRGCGPGGGGCGGASGGMRRGAGVPGREALPAARPLPLQLFAGLAVRCPRGPGRWRRGRRPGRRW